MSALPTADVDECVHPALHQCSPQADCNNTLGSYQCVCQQEYLDDDPNNPGVNCTGRTVWKGCAKIITNVQKLLHRILEEFIFASVDCSFYAEIIYYTYFLSFFTFCNITTANLLAMDELQIRWEHLSMSKLVALHSEIWQLKWVARKKPQEISFVVCQQVLQGKEQTWERTSSG